MKYLGLSVIFAGMVMLIAACHPNPANYHVPQGYRTCTSDMDCDRASHEFCGFVGVDTYAVCRQ